jgi:pyruvate dehydrogenase E2 component (dihydrolipoamide acetyltransferase)
VYEFKLPDLGEGVHEGEILKWYVEPGGTIEEDEPLVEVETDKAAVTIPSPVSGTVVSLAGGVGDIVIVGTVIAVIDDGSGDRPAAAPPAAEPPPAPASARTAGPVPAAPATRRLARELDVDLAEVTPTGPAGRVTPEDVQRHASAAGEPPAPEATPRVAEAQYAAHASTAIPFLDIDPLPDFSRWGPVEVEPLRSIRHKVAHKMVTSMILAPHVTHMDEADVTDLEAFRRQARETHQGRPGGKLTLLAFVVKAVTAGLRATPAFNASIDPFREEIVYKKFFNIGIAVDSGKGLVVPVIRDTDRKSILQISADIEELATRGRDGALEVGDLRGGTFTITNVGPLGGTALIPTINYPEVAILGMGKVQDRPVVRDGEIVIRKVLPVSLSFDHRIADGADAARFVTELVRHLSDPNMLLIET